MIRSRERYIYSTRILKIGLAEHEMEERYLYSFSEREYLKRLKLWGIKAFLNADKADQDG